MPRASPHHRSPPEIPVRSVPRSLYWIADRVQGKSYLTMTRYDPEPVPSGRAQKGGWHDRFRRPNRLQVQTAEQILDIIRHDGLTVRHHPTELSLARLIR